MFPCRGKADKASLLTSDSGAKLVMCPHRRCLAFRIKTERGGLPVLEWSVSFETNSFHFRFRIICWLTSASVRLSVSRFQKHTGQQTAQECYRVSVMWWGTCRANSRQTAKYWCNETNSPANTCGRVAIVVYNTSQVCKGIHRVHKVTIDCKRDWVSNHRPSDCSFVLDQQRVNPGLLQTYWRRLVCHGSIKQRRSHHVTLTYTRQNDKMVRQPPVHHQRTRCVRIQTFQQPY